MIKRTLLFLLAATALVIAAAGCRTAHGAGEDIEHAGEKIQEATSP